MLWLGSILENFRFIEITSRKSNLSKPVLSCQDLKFFKTNRYQTRTVNIKSLLFLRYPFLLLK